MHRALAIQDILSSILDQLSTTYNRDHRSELAALARTCRTFKEPALNELWNTLENLSPLVRCIPEASYRAFSESGGIAVRSFHIFCYNAWFSECLLFFSGHSTDQHGFSRPLTQTDLATLQGYTCRIRCVIHFNAGLDWESVRTFLNLPTTEPLFPNLRTLFCICPDKTMPLLCFPLPSLVRLSVCIPYSHWPSSSLELFPALSPGVQTLSISVPHTVSPFTAKFQPSYVSRWQNLSSLCCLGVMLDVDNLVYLSRTPTSTKLEFSLSATLPALDSPLVFSKLRELLLHSKSLGPISQLLSQIQLPGITSFAASIDDCPSSQDLTSFLADILISNSGHTIVSLELNQILHCRVGDVPRSGISLGFDDLRSCMAFSHLRDLEIDIASDIALTDTDLLTLASAWPKLQHLIINSNWGWNMKGGITPGGFIELLRTCRSLRTITLRFDTRGYTEVLSSQVPTSFGWTFPPDVSINALDSAIEAESVPAVAAFFCGLAACFGSRFTLWAWDCISVMEFQMRDEYVRRWHEVERQVDEALGRRAEYSNCNCTERY